MTFAILGLLTVVVAYVYASMTGGTSPMRHYDGWVILALVALSLVFFVISLSVEL